MSCPPFLHWRFWSGPLVLPSLAELKGLASPINYPKSASLLAGGGIYQKNSGVRAAESELKGMR